MQKNSFVDFGLLILRIGIGLMFIFHGWPKMAGGPKFWEGIGQTMGIFGIKFAPAFWGFMAAFSELFGGVCLILGIFVKPACTLMFITMFVASSKHLLGGEGLNVASHAIEMAIVFISLFLIGPGKYSLGK